MSEIIVGTRGSRLALAQTDLVIEQLKTKDHSQNFRVEIIQTEGDKLSHESLSVIGGQGIFIKEIEEALLQKKIDLAIHSLKDMPIEQPDGLFLGAILEREDPRDVLISRSGLSLKHLPLRSRIGTGSPRRGAQLLAWRSDLQIIEIRGNVDTRLKKLEAGQYDAIIVAAAGLKRLGLTKQITESISPEILLPAVGQGALAVEIRADDAQMKALVASINHAQTAREVKAEREFLAILGGGCRAPIAALAREKSGQMQLEGLVAQPTGHQIIRDKISGLAEQSKELAAHLAEMLLQRGAKKIIEELHHESPA
ncbi:hydroxymethylbilane synthase [Candidatus Acetothermia bacterium]|nr:hydroxymethylbilane synthase [Candidatus Acetothermia bacterium]MBI3642485.1 hydroxymethylbilane synthase [Candidatus Acetothermia bacterium]